MKKPLKLVNEPSVPEGMIVSVTNQGKLTVFIRGRDEIDPEKLRAGSLIYAGGSTFKSLKAAMSQPKGKLN